MWIPIEERLPEPVQEVLVTAEIDGERFVDTAVYAADVRNYTPRGKGPGFVKYDASCIWKYVEWTKLVRAWMPLPEAYGI